jgi:hypothetical protein
MSTENKVFTYKDKLNFLHVIGPDGGVLPQPITFRIAPRTLDVEINVTKNLLEWAESDEERKLIQDSMDRLLKMRAECAVYQGHFLPLTNGEWSEYVTKETKSDVVVQKHLVTPEGQPVFTAEEIRAMKGRFFTDAAMGAILEASEITVDLQVRINEEKQRTLKLLGKLTAETRIKREMTSKEMTSQAAVQGTSSSVTSTSNPGNTPDSRGSPQTG